MYKRWRVYSTFLTSLVIGFVYTIILSRWQSSSSSGASTIGLIEWNVLILAFSGILGGVIYSVMVDGSIEMPRFLSNQDETFKAGIFGDILIGISGAFILYSLLPPDVTEPDVGRISNTALAATGIIGGYGGRAVLKFALNRFFKDSQTFSGEMPLNTQLATSDLQEDLRQGTVSLAQSLIEKVDRYIEWGASDSDLVTLQQDVREASVAVRGRVFTALVDLHQAASQIKLTSEQLHRLISVYQALIASEPKNDVYFGQLALVYRDSTPPDLAQALACLDRAISQRGPLAIGKPWQYELNRAAIRIQQIYATTQSYDFSDLEQEWILADLLAIAEVYNLETILQAAQADQIPQTIQSWLRYHQDWLTARSDTNLLVRALGNTLGFNAEIKERLTHHQSARTSGSTFNAQNTLKANIGEAEGSVVVEEGILIGSQPKEESKQITTGETMTSEIQDFQTPDNPDGKAFPAIYSTLGRCYDILTLDPFDISHSAKGHEIFKFYPGEADKTEDEDQRVIVPRHARFIPGSKGSVSSGSTTNILYTEADMQRMYASVVSGIVTRLMGVFLPFSLSGSYQNFRKERRQEKSIYAFTRAEYVHYSLELSPHIWAKLHLNPDFQAAVNQLPAEYKEVEYERFIEEFGTHFSVQVTFGGVVSQRIRLNESTYAAVTQKGANLEAEAKKVFKAKYSKESESSTYREIQEHSEELEFSGGEHPANIHDWFATVKSDPAPIKLELVPLYELLIPDYFSKDASILQKQKFLDKATQVYVESKSEKLDWEPWYSIAAGGSGGSEFSDLEPLPTQGDNYQKRYQEARVKEVRVWIGACIDAVQIVLDDESSPFKSHGGSGGSIDVLKLGSGDYITGVEITVGSMKTFVFSGEPCVTSLKLFMNQSHPWTVGNHNSQQAIRLDVPSGYHVIGFHGRSGKYLDSLGVISIPMPENA
ncbi:MAC/perforin domain-containing protein [Phormidium sp. FACHB-1136]|uniref:MAC/perforin domain-containing protein n=1 Tax=Phormidium sp. FACHB-1136 TaxID=2692848 RepID=UPI00168791AC|nr:MAC/perforin domain-containing protein [Phormidium sp. FACHB-1136]MBD2427411.1 hypothetical protein [Phormidium sp. FACHB-1136]